MALLSARPGALLWPGRASTSPTSRSSVWVLGLAQGLLLEISPSGLLVPPVVRVFCCCSMFPGALELLPVHCWCAHVPLAMSLFFLMLSGALAAAACLLLAIPRRAFARRIAIPEQRESRRAPLAFVPLIVFAGVLLLYVGVENALGGWLPSYAVRVHASMQPSAVAFSFWVAELAGRLVGTALLVRLQGTCALCALFIDTYLRWGGGLFGGEPVCGRDFGAYAFEWGGYWAGLSADSIVPAGADGASSSAGFSVCFGQPGGSEPALAYGGGFDAFRESSGGAYGSDWGGGSYASALACCRQDSSRRVRFRA